MTTSLDFESPVHLKAVAAENLPAVTPALEDLYRGFEQELLVPLWTQIGDLMPLHPQSKGCPTSGGGATCAPSRPGRASSSRWAAAASAARSPSPTRA